jgi:hypothetical protein
VAKQPYKPYTAGVPDLVTPEIFIHDRAEYKKRLIDCLSEKPQAVEYAPAPETVVELTGGKVTGVALTAHGAGVVEDNNEQSSDAQTKEEN